MKARVDMDLLGGGIGQMMERIAELERRLREALPLLTELRDKSYDSGWISAKIELGRHAEQPCEEEYVQQELIQYRNAIFSKLTAILADVEEVG